MKRKMLFMVAALAVVIAACSTDSKVLPKKPVIKDQPLSNQYGQGIDAVPLTVTATTKDKKAKLSYQWYSSESTSTKGGAKIDGASGALTSGVEGGTFTPPTDAIGTFYYYVEITSTLSKEKAKTTSDVAIITVISVSDIPVISASNGDPSETGAGDGIVLTVTVNEDEEENSEDPVVSYQWYSNTRNSNSGGTLIEGETEASFMPSTQEEGTMYYYVVITRQSGKTMTSLPMRVTVVTNIIDPSKVNAVLPTITTQPVGGTFYVDLAVLDPPVLSVEASTTDRGVLSYQWFSNENENNTEGTPIEDAIDETYRPPMTTPGTVYYYVEVINTIRDNGDGGLKVRSVVSTPVRVVVIKGLDAIAPTISVHPVEPNETFDVGGAVTALTVQATIPAAQTAAGGKMTYQWYRYRYDTSGTNIIDDTPVPPFPPTNTDPTYGKLAAFTPPNERGLWYYYVIVTNTLPNADPPDGATKVATTKSNAACVGVGLWYSYLSGITVANKVYDGTVTASYTGTPVVTKNNMFHELNVVPGTVQFPQSNVGNGLKIVFVGWTLSGSDSGDYILRYPNLTANITQAEGSTVTQPTADTVTNNRITVTPVTLVSKPTSGQAVEYSRDGTNWQESPTFTGLNAAASYTIRARSKSNTNYAAGTPNSSAAIVTLDPVVTFAVNGGSARPDVTVTKGEKLLPNQIEGGDPTRSGFVFDYWYTTSALTIPYDFDLPVNNNMTIYAKWVSQADITAMAGKTVPMVWIRGGSYMMGAPVTEIDGTATERPPHKVNLSGFWMAKTETTQVVYQEVTGQNKSYWTDLPAGETGGRLPVSNVAFYEAVRFCNLLSAREGLTPAYYIDYPNAPGYGSSGWKPAYSGTDVTQWPFPHSATSTNLTPIKNAYDGITIVENSTGYRLPTEAQWEYAARGGTTTAYVGGNTVSTNTGWYADNSAVSNVKRPHAVGAKPVTPGNNYGLFDMHGNVAEWCWDWYTTPYPTGTQTNPSQPKGTSVQRVLRGGHYNSPATGIRSAYRVGVGSFTAPELYTASSNFQQGFLVGIDYGIYGFRVVRP